MTRRAAKHVSSAFPAVESAPLLTRIGRTVLVKIKKGEKRKVMGKKYVVVSIPAPDALEPYEWGPGGVPKGQPITFVSGEGWKIG